MIALSWHGMAAPGSGVPLPLPADTRGGDGAVDAGQAPLRLVALAPDWFRGQRHMDNEHYLVQCLFGLGGQKHRPALYWAAGISHYALVFYGADFGPISRRGSLAGHRWVHGDDGQSNSDVLTLFMRISGPYFNIHVLNFILCPYFYCGCP